MGKTSNTGTLPRRPRVFYGYWLVLATFLFNFIAIGFGSYAFSLFVTPLQDAFGWGRGQIMAGFTVFFVTMGVTCPVVGRLVDRYGARPVIPVGAVVMGLGFVLVSQMSQLFLFYLGYVLVGAGAAGMGQVPSSAIVSNWFKKRRGTAIGLMAAGVGAGGVLAPAIGFIIENHGWRSAYLSMAILIWMVAIPLGALVVRTRPSEMGLHPDGEVESQDNTGAAAAVVGEHGFTLRQAMATLPFWLIAVSFLFGSFSSMGLVQAPLPFLQDIGYPMQTAAAALGAIGIGSGLGKVFFGWLCDKILPKYAWAIGQGLMAASVAILLNIHADSPVALIWAYGLVLGLGVGAWLPTLSMLTSTSFGLTFYGVVFGALSLAPSIGAATGPFFAGLMYDATGTYYWAFTTFAAMFLVGIPAVLLTRRPKLPSRD